MKKLKSLLTNKIFVIIVAAVVAVTAIGSVLFSNNIIAVFNPSVTVTLDQMNGKEPVVLIISKGSSIAETDLPNTAQQGYVFRGWAYTDEPERILKADDVFKENTHLYAIYVRDDMGIEQNKYIDKASADISFLVESLHPITDENISSILLLDDINQTGVKLFVEPEGENYRVKGNPSFIPGSTYALVINDPNVAKFIEVAGENVENQGMRQYTFTIDHASYNTTTELEGIVDLYYSSVLRFDKDIGNYNGNDDTKAGYTTHVLYLTDNGQSFTSGQVINLMYEGSPVPAYYQVLQNSTKTTISGQPAIQLSLVNAGVFDVFEDYDFSLSSMDDYILVENGLVSEEEFAEQLKEELLNSEGYSVLMEMLIFGSKQTDEVKAALENLTEKERQAVIDTTYEDLAASFDAKSLANSLKVELIGNDTIRVAVKTPDVTLPLGTYAQVKFNLNIAFSVITSQQSTSFYIEEATGKKLSKAKADKTKKKWEYAYSGTRTTYETDMSFSAIFSLANNAPSAPDTPEKEEPFDMNSDLAEQIAEVFSKTENNTELAVKRFIESINPELIDGDVDFVDLIEADLGTLRFSVTGIDTIAINFKFVVKLGVKAGLNVNVKYSSTTLTVSANGLATYDGKWLGDPTLEITSGTIDQSLSAEEQAQLGREFIQHVNSNIKYIKVNSKEEGSFSIPLEQRVSVNFSIGGTIALRAGVMIEIKLSGFFLDKAMYIGVWTEIGAYARFTAFASYRYEKVFGGATTEYMVGGYKFDIGIYIDAGFSWKFFWFEGRWEVFGYSHPFFVKSNMPQLVDFSEKTTDIHLSGTSFNLADLASYTPPSSDESLPYADIYEGVGADIFSEDEQVTVMNVGAEELRFTMVGGSLSNQYKMSLTPEGNLTVISNMRTSSGKAGDAGKLMPVNPNERVSFKVIVSGSSVNFLTGQPVNKVLNVDMDMGAGLDFSKQFTVRFLNPKGDVLNIVPYEDFRQNGITYSQAYKNRGMENLVPQEFILFGNEVPTPEYTQSYFLYAEYIYPDLYPGNYYLSDEHMWVDKDGNPKPLAPTTEDTDYYLNIVSYEDMYPVRFNYTSYNETKQEYVYGWTEIDVPVGEIPVPPDYIPVGPGDLPVTKWDHELLVVDPLGTLETQAAKSRPRPLRTGFNNKPMVKKVAQPDGTVKKYLSKNSYYYEYTAVYDNVKIPIEFVIGNSVVATEYITVNSRVDSRLFNAQTYRMIKDLKDSGSEPIYDDIAYFPMPELPKDIRNPSNKNALWRAKEWKTDSAAWQELVRVGAIRKSYRLEAEMVMVDDAVTLFIANAQGDPFYMLSIPTNVGGVVTADMLPDYIESEETFFGADWDTGLVLADGTSLISNAYRISSWGIDLPYTMPDVDDADYNKYKKVVRNTEVLQADGTIKTNTSTINILAINPVFEKFAYGNIELNAGAGKFRPLEYGGVFETVSQFEQRAPNVRTLSATKGTKLEKFFANPKYLEPSYLAGNFLGWSLTEKGTEILTPDYVVTENLTKLYAVYKPVQVARFIAQGGGYFMYNGERVSQSIVYMPYPDGAPPTPLTVRNSVGLPGIADEMFYFDGWTMNSALNARSEFTQLPARLPAPAAGDTFTTFYAGFKQKISITFSAVPGAFANKEQFYQTYASPLENDFSIPSEPVLVDSIFKGWSATFGSKVGMNNTDTNAYIKTNIQNGVAINLYAAFEEKPLPPDPIPPDPEVIEVTITLDANGGEFRDDNGNRYDPPMTSMEIKCKTDESISIPKYPINPSLEIASGWSLTPDGDHISPSWIPSADTTLYARYEQIGVFQAYGLVVYLENGIYKVYGTANGMFAGSPPTDRIEIKGNSFDTIVNKLPNQNIDVDKNLYPTQIDPAWDNPTPIPINVTGHFIVASSAGFKDGTPPAGVPITTLKLSNDPYGPTDEFSVAVFNPLFKFGDFSDDGLLFNVIYVIDEPASITP